MFFGDMDGESRAQLLLHLVDVLHMPSSELAAGKAVGTKRLFSPDALAHLLP